MEQPVDPPRIFSRQRQKIFAFIWDNPNCTTLDIIEQFYPRALFGKKTVSVHLSMIKAGLAEATNYQMVHTLMQKSGVGRKPHRYKIIKKATIMPTSTSRLSYPDCESFLDAALEDELGVRRPFNDRGQAHQYTVRLNTFRGICREDNAKIYTDREHPLHWRCVYDPLEITIRGPDGNGEFWVYARKRILNMNEVESLAEIAALEAQPIEGEYETVEPTKEIEAPKEQKQIGFRRL